MIDQYQSAKGFKIAETHSGNFITLSQSGYSNSQMSSSDYPGFILTKFDRCGNVIWNRLRLDSITYGASGGIGSALGILEENNGNLIYACNYRIAISNACIYLIVADSNGFDLIKKRFSPIGTYDYNISNFIQIRQNKFLFIGNKKSRPFLLLFDISNNVLFDSTYFNDSNSTGTFLHT